MSAVRNPVDIVATFKMGMESGVFGLQSDADVGERERSHKVEHAETMPRFLGRHDRACFFINFFGLFFLRAVANMGVARSTPDNRR